MENKERVMSKYTLQNTRGITLVALVVTIVVLLILAGITIIMLFGENGIMQKAENAKTVTKDSTQKEVLDLAVLSLTGDSLTKESLEDKLSNLLKAEEFNITDAGSSLIIKFIGGKTYRVDKNGGISDINTIEEEIDSVESAEGSAIKIALSISGTKVTTPPIPSGFRYKEGSIDDGYVITDGTNEFVWIPVYQNQKISLTVTSKENISSINLYDPSGTAILTIEDTDVETNFENTDVTPTSNGIYIASVITNSGIATIKIFTVQSLYAKTLNILTPEALETLGATSIDEIETVMSRYGEDVNNAIVNTYQQYNGLLNYSDTVDYSNSVETNGGFYIGRYEAGAPTARTSGDDTATVTEIIATNGTPVCNSNQTPYNYITQSQAQGLAESMYQGKNYTCSLLTGAAWDRTLGFLTETGTNNKTMPQVYDDSGEWGNYYDEIFDVTNTSAKYSENSGSTYLEVNGTYTKPVNMSRLLTTGATTRNSAKNIYDIAGNVWEWTLEVNGSSVVCRGGSYNGSSNDAAIYRYDISASYYGGSQGFRPALYL